MEARRLPLVSVLACLPIAGAVTPAGTVPPRGDCPPDFDGPSSFEQILIDFPMLCVLDVPAPGINLIETTPPSTDRRECGGFSRLTGFARP
jgi:hypothetical protein